MAWSWVSRVRFISLVFVASILFAPAVGTATTCSLDSNNDGVVNVLDALDVLYCIVGLSDSNPHPSNPTRVKMLVIDGE